MCIGESKQQQQQQPAGHCTHSLSGVEVARQCELLVEGCSDGSFPPQASLSIAFCRATPHLSSQLASPLLHTNG